MEIVKDKSMITAAAELRRHAEERLLAVSSAGHPTLTKVAMLKLVHELEVHQIELEMQNEALSQARNEAEKALDKYTELYDFAPVGYFTLDRRGVVQAVNLRGASLLGVERSLLIGLRFGQFVTEEHRSAFTAFLETVFSSQGKETCEVALTNVKLSLIVQIEAMATETGQECRIAVIDITGRRRAEDAFRESEARMYKLAEMASDGIIMLDDSGTVTFCNAAAERMFGCSDIRTTDCEFHRHFIPDRLLTAAKRRFKRFREQGTGALIGRTTEVAAHRKDGTEFPLELSVSALKLQGKWHAIAIMRDITERKNMIMEIQEAREYAESIVETVRRPLVVLNTDLKVLSANQSFYKTFKLKPGETIGTYICDLGNRQWDIPELREYLEEIVRHDTVYKGWEIEHDFPGIGRKIIQLSARRILRKNIGLFGILLALEDITGRKEVEVSLRHDSTHDNLTGLYNRAFLDEELARIAHSRMFPVSIVIADVNELKKVNDTMGHEAGDNLIRLAAQIILRAFRAEDIVARIGGDEFAVLLPGTDNYVAEESVGRIMCCPEIINNQVSIAFGIATAENKDQLAEAFRLSDERMYRHKSELKNVL